jgi:ATP-dependent helicase HrpA
VALIKSLPKPVRRKMVPAPDTARRIVPQIRFNEGSLLERLAAALSRIAGEPISPGSFDLQKLPDELRMNVRVEGNEGGTLAEGRDLDTVRRELGASISASFAQLDDPQWTRDGLVDWDFDELPETVEVVRDGVLLQGYPALVDQGESVALRLMESARRASDATRHGLRRLCFLAARRELETQVKWLPDVEKLRLYAASIPRFSLTRQLAELIADRAFVADQPVPRTKAAFQKTLTAGRKRLVPAVQEVAALAGPLFEQYHRARLVVDEATAPLFQHAVADVQTQLDDLVGPDFLTATPWKWLTQFPRYFRAIQLRFDKLRSGSLDRDRRHTEEIAARVAAFRERTEQHPEPTVPDLELIHYRWMLEEYRVSLFAQELGTSLPVSAKRLDRQWAKISDVPAP